MTKFILHGGFTSAPNELNRTFYGEITKGLPEGSTVLLIYFAREPEEWEALFEDDKGRIIENTELGHLKIISATREGFEDEVRKADVIYIRGGNTKKLIKTVREYPTFIDDIEGKVVAGSSAGAQMWSVYYCRSQTGKIEEGLGVLPIRLVCHYGSDKFPVFNDDAVELMKKYPENLELVVFKDHEWRVFEVEESE